MNFYGRIGKMNPLFSIIIPAYNAGKFLGKAVDSVLEQDFNDYELIIVDDGSTDNTPQICKEYVEKYSQIYVVSQSNKGLAGARNSGMRVSRGQYILFLDADDYIEPVSLSVLSKSITQLGCPDILVFGIFSNKFPWVPSDNPVNTVLDREYIETVIIPEQINLRPRTRDIQPFSVNKAYRKEIIDTYSLAFDESYRKWEDKDFVLSFLIHAQTMVCLDTALYNYESVVAPTVRLSTSFDPSLILSIPSRSKKTFGMFDEKYHLSESEYYKRYMFEIVLGLCKEMLNNVYEKTKTVLCTVFSDELVKDWASAVIAKSKIEKEILYSIEKNSLDNLEEMLIKLFAYREKKERRDKKIKNFVSLPKRCVRKAARTVFKK